MIEVLRLPLAVAAGICAFCGYILGTGPVSSVSALLLFAAVTAIAAGTMPLNDLVDLRADKVNRPERPIPSGRVKPWQAVTLFLVLSVAGVGAAAFVNRPLAVAAASLLVVATLYNLYGKRLGLAGNAMVSLCVGSTFTVGALARSWPPGGVPVAMSAVTVLVSLALETAGDIHDAAGDRESGNRSFTVTHGVRAATALYITLCALVALLACALPLLLDPGRLFSSLLSPVAWGFWPRPCGSQPLLDLRTARRADG